MTKHKIPYMRSSEIRQTFLSYFQKQGHTIVPSSSLVPTNDPTLLFTNAGMVQFKEVFLGKEKRAYTRAASAQGCVRAGGKHNDLDRVGYTARHHTFFEMLGNFSFGDYFKKEAIYFAWEFITKQLQLPKEKLWITVYTDDQEAADIWLKDIKINPDRFTRCGESDNFWSMGPTGPCGPCTEIFFDHGPSVPGGPPGSENEDGDRYIEIWNLVFMQYDRGPDGALSPLPMPSVDTGMGLERLAAIMQNVNNNFETDLFQPLIKTAAQIANISNLADVSLQVIADHIRSCSFLITDGVIPSNEGRGYVLRRIIRRALRHGHKLNIKEPFFYKLVPTLVEIMGEAYLELKRAQKHVEKTLQQEELQFSATLEQGLKLFEQYVKELKGDIIPGEIIFKLYDTYGFPADLTADMAREKNLLIDWDGFEIAMSKQRTRSRQSGQFVADYTVLDQVQAPTEFTGHKKLPETDIATSKILAIYRESKFANELEAGEKGSIVLDRTPFYAEAGGQVGDQGLLSIPNQAYFKVLDTIKQGHVHLHLGKLEKGKLKVGDEINAEIDVTRRAATVLNHTATHLLHLVLRQVIGEHALQKGSLVEPTRLRFDFAHEKPLTAEELKTIEERVNAEIRANYHAKVDITTPEEAFKQGAIGLFGEKYGSKVRVVHFGPSVELCGGTHAEHTGDIGLFKITTETGIAAGIRRIEAVTGEGALKFIEEQQEQAQQKLKEADERMHALEKELLQLKNQLAYLSSTSLLTQVKLINDIKVLTAVVEGVDGKTLRSMLDHLKQELGSAIIMLAIIKEKKVGLVVGVTPNLINKFNAKEIIRQVATMIDGKGGGRAELAEGGGNNPDGLSKAFAWLAEWVSEK